MKNGFEEDRPLVKSTQQLIRERAEAENRPSENGKKTDFRDKSEVHYLALSKLEGEMVWGGGVYRATQITVSGAVTSASPESQRPPPSPAPRTL